MPRRLLLFDEGNQPNQLALKLKAFGYEINVLGLGEITDKNMIEQADLVMVQITDFPETLLKSLIEIRSLPYYPPLMAVIETEHSLRTALLLECGCDCVVGPASDVLRVKAWIDALLRRQHMYSKAPGFPLEILRVGDLEINVPARMVRTRTRSSRLTGREMALLLELARRSGTICKRADLLLRVWGSTADSLAGTLNTFINRLRMKIEDDYRKPRYLIGIYGVGYRLMAEPGEPGSKNQAEAAGATAEGEAGSETSSPRRRARRMKARSKRFGRGGAI